MSEHLQFTPIAPTAAVSPATMGGAAPSDGHGLLDVFAALLDKAGITPPKNAAALAAAAAGSGASAATADPAGSPTADPHGVLKDFVDALKALQTALDAGQPPDPALLDRLDRDADSIAEALGVPQKQKPQLVQSLGAIAGLAAAVLAPALLPLVSAATPVVEAALDGIAGPGPLTGLPAKLDELATRLGPADAALAAKLAAIGDQLGSGKTAPEVLAGLAPGPGDAAADTDLDNAIKTLLADRPAAPTPPQPATAGFAAAKLAVPDQGAPATTEAEAGVPPLQLGKAEVKSAAKPDGHGPHAATTDTAANPRTDARPAAAVAADKSADPAPPSTNASIPAPQPTTPAQAAAAAPKPLPAAYQTPQVNLPQLAFEIARQAQHGTSRFQIRLDPPELGRIDVRMDVDGGGNLSARLTVERSETLDLLQRDHRGLERALAQAGVDGSKTNLEFSLKQNPFERPQGSPFAALQGSASVAELAAEAPIQSTVTFYRGAASPGGVNIFV